MCVTTGAMTLSSDSQRIYLVKGFSFRELTPAGWLALPPGLREGPFCVPAEDQIMEASLSLLFLCIVH